jgi:hypothetical protein
MRDFELDPHGHRVQRPDPATAGPNAAGPDAAPARPFGPGRSPGLDAASLMHLQRTAGNAGVVQLLAGDEEASPVHEVVGSGGGTPLDESTRSTMESAFGASFDHVRVHDDEQASKSAESVGANAYTVGSDVVFRSGQYNPSSAVGQRTLAHELAHVVQQSQGPVDGTDAAGGIRVSDPSDRFERAAEQTADDVMASVQTSRVTASAGSAAPVAQLEEDEAGQAFVQRQATPEEEEEELPA